MIRVIIIIALYIKIFSSAYANPNLNIRTGILVDYHSDEILYEFDPDTGYPASMTKIMTSIIAFDLIKKNKLSLDDIHGLRKCLEAFTERIFIYVYNGK